MNLVKFERLRTSDDPARAENAKLNELLDQLREERQRTRSFKSSMDDLRQTLDDAALVLNARIQELSDTLEEADKEVFGVPLGQGEPSRLKKALRSGWATQAGLMGWRATARSRIRQKLGRPERILKSPDQPDGVLDPSVQSPAVRL